MFSKVIKPTSQRFPVNPDFQTVDVYKVLDHRDVIGGARISNRKAASFWVQIEEKVGNLSKQPFENCPPRDYASDLCRVRYW